MKNFSHLSIDSAEDVEVAIAPCGVGTVDGLLIGFDGLWCLAHIGIGSSQKVMGEHPFIAGTVAVEVTDEDALQAVAAEDRVCLIHRLQCIQLLTPLITIAATRKAEQRQNTYYDIISSFHAAKIISSRRGRATSIILDV